MSVTVLDLSLYAGALLVLFLTPGPVWAGVIARGLTSGYNGVWPLALGVMIGDMLWAVFAILGVTWVLSVYGGFLEALKWVAAAVFIGMGIMVLRHAGEPISKDSRLTRPGMWAGFAAGLALIIGNPKAILFYMGMLPGFFDVTALTAADIALIAALSAIVPLIGNMSLALFIERAKRLITSARGLRRINIGAGIALVAVGCLIPLL